MADAVTSQTIQDGDRIAVMKFTNISDGSGEAAVTKVDVSGLQAESDTARACAGVTIQQAMASTISGRLGRSRTMHLAQPGM